MLLFQQGNNSRFLQQIYFKKKKKKLFRMCPALICVLSVQSQVDEVIDVMQENISKVIERGEHLDDLQDKSGESQCHTFCHTSSGFCACAGRLYFSSTRTDSTERASVLFLLTFTLQSELPGPGGVQRRQGNTRVGLRLSAMCFQFKRKTQLI